MRHIPRHRDLAVRPLLIPFPARALWQEAEDGSHELPICKNKRNLNARHSPIDVQFVRVFTLVKRNGIYLL
jgi:hypothetical protein